MFQVSAVKVKDFVRRISSQTLKSAGATVVQEPYQMDGDPGWIATLSDPDGNYFQLMSPMPA